MEALDWQGFSNHGSQAEMTAGLSPFGVPVGIRAEHQPPREPNRLVEIHGLMGAIGEQVSLAYAGEQDAQRLIATADSRSAEHQTLVLRATSESAGYYVLGACHSLANLVVRILTLNAGAAAVLNHEYKTAKGFPPLSDDKRAWVSLNTRTTEAVVAAVAVSGNPGMESAVAALEALAGSPAFHDLDTRRGMDYHRRRPQSVPHASPRKGTVHDSNGTRMTSMVVPRKEAEADAAQVHGLVVRALTALLPAMRSIREALPGALAGESIFYQPPSPSHDPHGLTGAEGPWPAQS